MSSTPMPQPEASEAVRLARLMLRAVLDDYEAEFIEGEAALPWRNAVLQGRAVLAAGYVSPDRLASLLTEARPEAWDNGARAGQYNGRGGGLLLPLLSENPYRASGGAR